MDGIAFTNQQNVALQFTVPLILKHGAFVLINKILTST